MRWIDELPVIAEAGCNHNGSVNRALDLCDAAKDAGASAIKFQMRTPEICVPPDQLYEMRDTPWGRIPYLGYRNMLELSQDDWDRVDQHCCDIGLPWFASVWDIPSLERLQRYNVPAVKIPSACLTDDDLLHRAGVSLDGDQYLVLSTGMSFLDEIYRAASRAVRSIEGDESVVGLAAVAKDDGDAYERLILMACTSAYPTRLEEINLATIKSYQRRWNMNIGYSGHENPDLGSVVCVAAVGMGATMIERHFTLDRSDWGSDHAYSMTPDEFAFLVSDVRDAREALGDGRKRVFDSELPALSKLRRFTTSERLEVKTQ